MVYSPKRKNPHKYKIAYYMGHLLEYWAIILMICKGYRFIAMRVHAPFGEIDAIFNYRRDLILCEIKYRKNSYQDFPITNKQIKKYQNNIDWCLRKYKFEFARIDGIIINKYFAIRHYKNLLGSQ